MKRSVLVILGCSFAFAADHSLIIKLGYPVSIPAYFTGFDLLSYRQLNDKPVYKVRIDSPLDRQSLLDQLYSLPEVAGVEENQMTGLDELETAASVDTRAILILDETQIDTRAILILDEGEEQYLSLFSQNYSTQIRAIDAWPYATGAGVVVAVLDTGIDPDHQFFDGNLVPGYDFVDNDPEPWEERLGMDTNGNGYFDEGWGHGTHVAGILKMVAPDVSIMPIRVADSDGQADLFNLVQGISFALLAGADVINLSMSIDEPSPLLEEWLQLAKFAGAVVVTSAGNDNSEQLKFPSTESEVITVTSVGPDNLKSPFSNYSRMVDVAAPGEAIYSAHPGDSFVARSGTSMAAPMVSGEVAIIFELVPGASVEYIAHRVKNKSENIDALNPGYRKKLGKGLADVWNAITLQNQ